MLRCLTLFVSLSCLLPSQDANGFTIGTWNIEFLGADPKFRRDTPPRSADDLKAIGRKVRELGVSLLGVQEICGEDILHEVARAAGPGWRAVLGTSGSWSDGKTQQGVGILYDDAVLELIYAEEMLSFPSKLDEVSVFHRKPVTAALRHRETGCDFRVVVVHLKAGRKDRDKQKRKAEATYLRGWIDGLLRDPNEDHDILVFGDFNCSYGDAPEAIFEAGGAMRYLDQPKAAPTIMHFDTPIDQICVTETFREIQRDSLRSHHVEGEAQRLAFRKTYSDHFPVTARVTPPARDDDPAARFCRGTPQQSLPTNQRPVANATAIVAKVQWPLLPGTPVRVMIEDEHQYEGTFVHLDQDRGWVVIKTADGLRAWPKRRVKSILAANKK